jgi:hypothetical protein
MIEDDEGLKVVLEQLQLAESMLEKTHQQFGHNPVQYKLFADGLIDLIEGFRSELRAHGVMPEAIGQLGDLLTGQNTGMPWAESNTQRV